jgi:hypothetical protein
MPAKKGKVEQVHPANDPPEGARMFVRFLLVQVCFLTHFCCEQMTTKTRKTMTKMLSSLR